jgi:hypothetical protein
MPRSPPGFSKQCRAAWDRFGFEGSSSKGRERLHRSIIHLEEQPTCLVPFRDKWLIPYKNNPAWNWKWNGYIASPTIFFNSQRKHLRNRVTQSVSVYYIETSNFLANCRWRQSFKTLSRNFRRRRRLQAASKLNELKDWVPSLSPIVASYL